MDLVTAEELVHLAKNIGEANEDNGFHKDKGWFLETNPESVVDYVFKKLMLVVSEVVEAGDELRAGRGLEEVYYGPAGKPEGFLVETADAFVRLLDLMAELELTEEFVRALREKLAYNTTRPFKHGKAF